jgi:hypothetical protein
MARYKKKYQIRQEGPQRKSGEVLEVKVKSYFGKITHTAKYNINNPKDMENLTYFLLKMLNLPLDKICTRIKRKKEKP